MHKVKTLKDLDSLKEHQTLPDSLLVHLEDYFHQLYEALADGESLEEEFCLEQHGYFVVLEGTDDLRDLHEVGLNLEDHGLLGIWPEYVERLTLDNKINPELPYEWYKVAVLYDQKA